MQRQYTKAACDFRPILPGPFAVFVHVKNMAGLTGNMNINYDAGNPDTYSRDGPLIFHTRDGPFQATGPPGGEAPLIICGHGPPKKTGPPMEWLVRKKNLNRS
jgi:hypothetical protein